ncbi:MAG TPA: PDZ domain-containing protein [Phycisphaerae bacterium]|nr:PDZ domain-containing protein [Phycisphaerae bacterium]
MLIRPAALMALVPFFLAAAVRADVDFDAKTKEVAKSLVIVDFTLRNENSSRQDSGQGILLSQDGVVLIPGTLISEQLPKEWVSEIKIRLPGKNFESVPAKLLGRTRNRLFAYLKTEKPVEAPAFEPGNGKEVKLGQSVFSVAISSESGGYTTYMGKSEIRAMVNLSHTLANTSSFGLTRGNSPVFDSATGDFVGITFPGLGESMILRDGGSARRIELQDEDQCSVFLPISECLTALHDVPKDIFDLRRPWLPVDDMAGLQEDVRTLKKITQTSGVMVGSVIPGEAADKAGLKARDIILTVDGKEFSNSPVPDMMVMHFSRIIDEKKPGDKITLGVLRDGNKVDVPVTLSTLPRMGSEMAHVFSSKLGVVTRDMVFADAYSRRLPQDTKGVMVALVKTGSPASLGTTPLRPGLLITKLDDQPVENQQQFLDVLKKEEEKTDLKEMVFVVIQPSGETQVCRVDLSK